MLEEQRMKKTEPKHLSTGREPWRQTHAVARALTLFAVAVVAYGWASGSSRFAPVTLTALAFAIPLTVGTLFGVFRNLAARPSDAAVVVDDDSVTLMLEPTRVVLFEALRGVARNERSVSLEVGDAGGAQSTVTIETSGAEASARIALAIEEAWAAWKARPPVTRSATEALLAKPAGVTARDWIERIDATPVAKPGAGDAYRTGGVDADSLWATLDDPNAAPEARAAAARLLHADETNHVRVADAVRVVDDPDTRARIEATLKPAEEAAAELEALETESLRRTLGR